MAAYHLEQETLRDKAQTARNMYRFIDRYFHDLDTIKTSDGRPLSKLSLKEFFDLVRLIPYRQDNKPIEVIARPKHILTFSGNGMDCKKKAILISSYLKRNRIPYRLVGSSRKPSGKIHHVFPQAFIAGQWENLDATYSNYRPFAVKRVTAWEVL